MAQPEEKLVEKKEPFKIEDDSAANWALRKLRKLMTEKKDAEEFAKSELDKVKAEIDEWLDGELSKLQGSIDYFENLLHNYAMEKKEEDPELKTKKLPFGELQFRKKPDKWVYDEEKLLNSVKKSVPQAIQVTEKVNKNELKKLVKVAGSNVVNEDGELIDGVIVQPGQEIFKVKVKEG